MFPKFVSVEEMITIEKAADASGHSYAQMMEHAGRGLAEIIIKTYRQLAEKSAFALVGKGNNGGDALVALDYLNQAGWQTTALIVNGRRKDDLRERLVGKSEILWTDKNDAEAIRHLIANHSVFVDGLLGTGIRLPLRRDAIQLLAQVQQAIVTMNPVPIIVAVDCPSGMDCDTGEVAPETPQADLTVCMAAVKRGMLTLPAFEYIGRLRVANIGLPDGLEVFEGVPRFVVEGDWVRRVLPKRPLDAHKGTFGKVMIIAGSRNYGGASLLAARAAFRSGAGWIMLAVPGSLQASLAGHFPEATWIPLAHEDGAIGPAAIREISDNFGAANSILLGPGLGLAAGTEAFINDLINPELPPMVIDADGLKLLARVDKWREKLPADCILTPHPGEMSVLTGMDPASIQSKRLELAERFAAQWGQVVVLKGAFTVVAAPGGSTAIIPLASPALARAGTGDVLAGIIAGLRAQGMRAFEAAAAGAWLHGQAGLSAAEKVGSTAAVLAGDLVSELGPLLKKK